MKRVPRNPGVIAARQRKAGPHEDKKRKVADAFDRFIDKNEALLEALAKEENVGDEYYAAALDLIRNNAGEGLDVEGLAQALRVAVEGEREACARVPEMFAIGSGNSELLASVATVIRARGHRP